MYKSQTCTKILTFDTLILIYETTNMIERVTILLVWLAVAKAGTIGSYFTPEPTKPSAYPAISSPPNYKANPEPAPIYENDESAQETQVNSVDKQRYSFGSIYRDSIGAPLAYNALYSASNSPTVKTNSGPVTYTTHAHSIPFELQERPYTASDVPKSSELPYNSYNPIQNEAIKTSLAYAEAPAVSHMTFTGLGTTYTW
ncbi:uncharacterized protein LOC124543699 [Vanessa cardui]|uniref:uncharacterized protein LOC124543699 n=1 Tax=Vanessa cardui TaxID=171605 RepID=UPI001F145857|nr:uncharacterized protein LOC124543699 [Vanessa cardui]